MNWSWPGSCNGGRTADTPPVSCYANLARGRQSVPDAQARIGEVLDDLALVTGQRARFGVLCGHALGVSYLQRPDGGHSWDGGAYERPALLPAHATAVGKALLAHAPPPVFDRLLQRGLMAYTAHTPTSEERLRQEILTTLKRGVAISQGEWHDAKLAVATPVFGPSGLAIGALELTLPGAGDLQAARSILIVAARGLSRRLVEIAPYLPAEFGVAPLLWRDLGRRSGRQSMTAGSSTATHRADTVSPSA